MESRFSFAVVVLFACLVGSNLATSQTTDEALRAAVFRASSPDSNAALAAEIATVVAGAGYTVEFIDPVLLSDPAKLLSHKFDLLVLPGARSLPVAVAQSIPAYLAAGGNLLALGLPAWQSASSQAPAPRLETFSPNYQFYPVHGAAQISTPEELALLSPVKMNPPSAAAGQLQAMQPRPRGIGFDQQKPWRWQPLLEARLADGEYRGAIATLLLHFRGSSRGGIWANFTPEDLEFYQRSEVRRVLQETLLSLRRGLFLEEGGSEFFTVFDGQQFRLGARVANIGKANQTNVLVRLNVREKIARRILFSREWPLMLKPGDEPSVQDAWSPPSWPAGGLIVTTELSQNGKIIDRLEHELNVWRPKAQPEFVETREGGFWLGGKPWKAHGVNYMPSSGIGVAEEQYYEYWLGRGAYDPEVIERDLCRIQAMNLNAVSIFIYHSELKTQHLLDFLRRCEAHGLHVNQSLRPGSPLNFRWAEMKELIEFYRLAENDTIFAYDLDWEPHHEQNTYGQDWKDWVKARYGTLENAEKAWAVPAPVSQSPPALIKGAERLDMLAIPPMHQLTHDGEWRKLVADYRAFLDAKLSLGYAAARRLVKSIDPHHAVSFRMAHSGDPTFTREGMLAYDFFGLSDAVDIWEPEAYGRIGDWNRVRDGRFEADYARLCDASKPLMWAEMGVSVWDKQNMAPSLEKLEFQGRYCRDFHRMMSESGAAGIFYWWYPGGFRVNEASDFGIINSDGTDRPVTKVIREEGARFLRTTKPAPPNYYIEVDRDRDARGLFGMYEAVKDEYWKAIAAHNIPALKWKPKPGQEASAPQK
jgi:hypothetical protein